MAISEIKIYTIPNCPNCAFTKHYFDSRKIPYQEIDISKDLKAKEEMEKNSHQDRVPVIVKNNKDMLVGYNKILLDRLIYGKCI